MLKASTQTSIIVRASKPLTRFAGKKSDAKRPDKEIIQLLSYSLKYNNFIFNNQCYLQTGGTAMGKKFAPNYANIFMAKWEKEALKNALNNPKPTLDS